MAVYFLASPRDQVVKVGFSGNPGRRVSDLLRTQPDPSRLSLLWVFSAGTLADEAVLHQYLVPHKTFGEWFKLGTMYPSGCCGQEILPHVVRIRGSLADADYCCSHCQNGWGQDGPASYGPKFVVSYLNLARREDIQDEQALFGKELITW